VRERENVSVGAWLGKRVVVWMCVFVCMYVREVKRVRERERECECGCMIGKESRCVNVCVCLYVCMWERLVFNWGMVTRPQCAMEKERVSLSEGVFFHKKKFWTKMRKVKERKCFFFPIDNNDAALVPCKFMMLMKQK